MAERRAAPRVGGAVLAGGRCRRLGGPKALASLAGRPLLAHPISSLRRAGLEPVVVAKPGSPLAQLDCLILREPAEPAHPLVGLIAALEASDDPVVALGCDMPFVPPELLAWIASIDAPLVVPRVQGRLQPLVARYDPRLAPELRAALAERAPLREAVGALGPLVLEEDRVAPFGDPATIAFNVNEPADLERAERMLAGAGVSAVASPLNPGGRGPQCRRSG